MIANIKSSWLHWVLQERVDYSQCFLLDCVIKLLKSGSWIAQAVLLLQSQQAARLLAAGYAHTASISTDLSIIVSCSKVYRQPPNEVKWV